MTTFIGDAASAQRLAQQLFDPLRDKPLVVVSPTPAGTQLIDVNKLQDMARPTADVAVVTCPRACYALSDELPRTLQVYGGAVRIYRPGLGRGDAFDDHPLVIVHRHAPTAAITRIVQHLGLRPAKNRDSDIEKLASALEEERAAHARTCQELEHARALVDALSQERDQARRDVRRLNRTLKSFQQEATAPPQVYADPEEQFRFEIQLTWLCTTTEADRLEWPLRDYRLSEGFLASVDAQQLVGRERVLRACVDVLTGRVVTVAGRAAHRLRIDPGGSSPPVTRSDRAVAWRCAIQRNSPSAARLTWWEPVHQDAVELSHIGPHDDIKPR